MIRRFLPALAGGAAITFLLLLALPLPAMHKEEPLPAATLRASYLSWEASLDQSQIFPQAPVDSKKESTKKTRQEPKTPPPASTKHPEPKPEPMPEPVPPGMTASSVAVPATDATADSDTAKSPTTNTAANQEQERLSATHPNRANAAYELGEVDRAPRVQRGPAPKYPSHARRKGITGTVLLRFLVELDGSVTQIQILQTDPPGVFEKSAVQAVQGWRFAPGQRNGKPVRTWVRLPVRFRLER